MMDQSVRCFGPYRFWRNQWVNRRGVVPNDEYRAPQEQPHMLSELHAILLVCKLVDFEYYLRS